MCMLKCTFVLFFNILGRDLFYKMNLNSPFMFDDMYMNPFSTTCMVFCVWRFEGG